MAIEPIRRCFVDESRHREEGKYTDIIAHLSGQRKRKWLDISPYGVRIRLTTCPDGAKVLAMHKQFPKRMDVRCTEKDKIAWRKAAKHDKSRDVATWIRTKLNEAASALGF